MDSPELEAAIIRAIGTQDPERDHLLEALLAGLLADLLGLGPRATDGLVLLREAFDATSFFAVGTPI